MTEKETIIEDAIWFLYAANKAAREDNRKLSRILYARYLGKKHGLAVLLRISDLDAELMIGDVLSKREGLLYTNEVEKELVYERLVRHA